MRTSKTPTRPHEWTDRSKSSSGSHYDVIFIFSFSTISVNSKKILIQQAWTIIHDVQSVYKYIISIIMILRFRYKQNIHLSNNVRNVPLTCASSEDPDHPANSRKLVSHHLAHFTAKDVKPAPAPPPPPPCGRPGG